MASSIEAQLKAIRASLKGREDLGRRPITRPSVLFEPREASDIDLQTILPIALSGLDVLVVHDVRFGTYRNTLFSHTSLDLDREKMDPKDELKVNKSISSYLRLLSGYLHLPAALKTLEYLIRRYRVHVFNTEDMILCALPHHDTHAFVRIIQLLELGNNKWGFLEAVRSSGAPPPRNIIVQQCIRDKGVFEAICNYALPTKASRHSKATICFCMAVIVEALGAIKQLESDTVKLVIPFIFSGLNPDSGGGDDHKAGALMMVGLVASRSALSQKLSNNLIYAIGRMAQQDSKELSGVPWHHMALMTIVTIVQTQSLPVFPKKSLKCLIEIRDFAIVVKRLSQEFNTTKFLLFLLEALIDCSPSDASCCWALSSIIETVPMRSLIDIVASKVLSFCVKWARGINIIDSPEAGSWAKQIFAAIDRVYPSEWRGAVSKFLENSKLSFKEEDDATKTLFLITNGSLDDSFEVSDSKIWFALEHPKAAVRRAALSGLSASSLQRAKDTDTQKLIKVQDVIMHRLQDDDLSVVLAALSIKGLAGIFKPPLLLKAFQSLVVRCFGLFKSGSSDMICKASDVLVSCLEFMALNFCFSEFSCSREVATMIFPFLLVLPKTWKVNLKALELAKDLNWPFYLDSFASCWLPVLGEQKGIEPSEIISINQKTVEVMATIFLKSPESHIEWLAKCCESSQESLKLFLSLLLKAILIQKEDSQGLLRLICICHRAINDVKQERLSLIAKEFTFQKLDDLCNEFTKGVVWVTEVSNDDIILCLYWSMLKAISGSPKSDHVGSSGEWHSKLEDLFVFFVTSPAKNAFREHLLFLVRKCCALPAEFLSGFYSTQGFPVAVQLQSLKTFAALCSSSLMHNADINDKLQFLSRLPSLLIPLSDEDKDVRTAAMECIEGLYKLLQQCDASKLTSGGEHISTSNLVELLGLVIGQKILILSDTNFLSSFLMSFNATSQRLMVSDDVEQRFGQEAKEKILTFLLTSGLKLSSFGKFRVLSLFKRLGSSMLEFKVVKALLDELLNRRKHCGEKLSEIEIRTLCLLLEISLMHTSFGAFNSELMCFSLEALKVDGRCGEGPAVVEPCVAVLRSLKSSLFDSLNSEVQEELIGGLIVLYHGDDDVIRNAAKGALMEINISSYMIAKLLQVIASEIHQTGPTKIKRKKQSWPQTFICGSDRGKFFSFLSSILDVLLLKKEMSKREVLVEPLFKLLRRLMENDGEKQSDALDDVSYIEQTVLLVLQDITDSVLCSHHPGDDFIDKFDIRLLIECAQTAKDAATVNLVFSLLSSATRISPHWVSENMFELFNIIGHSAARQIDSHSQRVTEELISALVPCWLSTSKNVKNLLQVFVNVLPEVIEERRLTLVVHLLRTLGEKASLGVLVSLLLHLMAMRKDKSSPHDIPKEWEYNFAMKLFDQYSCKIGLPSLVVLLQETGTGHEHESLSELHLTLYFILQRLQDTGFVFTIESERDSDYIQNALRVLMEKVILLLKVVDRREKKQSVEKSLRKQLKGSILGVVNCISEIMAPSQFFTAIGELVGDDDQNVKKKALRLLCQTITNRINLNESKKRLAKPYTFIDERNAESFCELCSKIVHLVDYPDDDGATDDYVKVVAVSSLEVLVKAFPTSDYISTSCLAIVAKHITSDKIALSSSCLQSTAALISVLGSKMLPVLPLCMKNVLEKSRDQVSSQRTSVHLSVIRVLDVVIENLSGFVSPYLEGILELLVLHPDYASEADEKVKSKATLLRKLIAEKIPARLLLAPLLKVFKLSLNGGERGTVLAFEMLENMVGSMNRSSVASYHVKIFEQCFVALDLRRQRSSMIKDVDVVEDKVIDALTALTVKLTESMFRPLFVHAIDWAESDIEDSDPSSGQVLCRKITFFKLVNKLVLQHRSLFVPYFKYLIEGCVRYLGDGEAAQAVSLKKKHKKAKIKEASSEMKMVISPEIWHLRSLILSSLYRCFLYDTGNFKFLDSSNFQVLLKPTASQLLVDPPAFPSEQYHNLPTVDEVDESLVSCLGQMAVTVGSDDIWKPLNHEVLMHTRSEKVRARILGLRVIKYLVEHLKEEYLVCLPETIPFLSELLEDVELAVKSLAQEILRELESLSGESLHQYL